jgi:hypothetical protein
MGGRLTGVLVAVAICAGLAGCSASGPDLAVKPPMKPVALPAPGVLTTSASLCTTAFGSPVAVAKEFGASSLKLTVSETEPQHPYSIFQCGYVPSAPDSDGLALTLTTQNLRTVGIGGNVYVGKSGAIYVYANTPGHNDSVPRNLQEWLQKAAARVTVPTICKTTGQTTTCTRNGHVVSVATSNSGSSVSIPPVPLPPAKVIKPGTEP